MRIAFECPTYLLRDIQPLGDFDWILAHLVLQDEDYAKFYKESSRIKVLDNSVNELLEPCSLDDLFKASEIVNPDIIVAPDYLGDSEKTLESLEEVQSSGLSEIKILPVVQGSDLDEISECALAIRGMGFKRVAVPYDITLSREHTLKEMGEKRPRVISYLHNLFDSIHLLGFTTLDEFENYSNHSNKFSIDTGKPILFGLNQTTIESSPSLIQGKPTLEQMPKTVDEMDLDSLGHRLRCIYRNIAVLRRATNGIGG